MEFYIKFCKHLLINALHKRYVLIMCILKALQLRISSQKRHITLSFNKKSNYLILFNLLLTKIITK